MAENAAFHATGFPAIMAAYSAHQRQPDGQRTIGARHQAEARSRTRLDAVHAALERGLRISIHFYLNWLPGPHVGQLGLFEIRHHPDFARHNRQQGLSRLHVSPRLHRAPRHKTIRGRGDLCVGKIKLSLARRGFSLLHVCNGRRNIRPA